MITRRRTLFPAEVHHNIWIGVVSTVELRRNSDGFSTSLTEEDDRSSSYLCGCFFARWKLLVCIRVPPLFNKHCDCFSRKHHHFKLHSLDLNSASSRLDHHLPYVPKNKGAKKGSLEPYNSRFWFCLDPAVTGSLKNSFCKGIFETCMNLLY